MNNCLAFRNIRYAAAERFSAATLVPLEGLDSENGAGPIPPQSPSRFDVLLGPPADLEQSEDCQVLSVFTPGNEGKRPVMVWFHGGAFITGGGELPWYDGSKLSSEQDVVVVSVTARLGALGYLCLDDGDNPSPATTDHMAAVEWVHRYIDRFGGDPENITLFGQSAGGFAIEVLQRWGLGPHVKNVIYQSSDINLDRLSYQREDVMSQAKAFAETPGQDPRPSDPGDTRRPVTIRRTGRHSRSLGPDFRPQDEQPIRTRVLGGWTRDDMLPFIMFERGIFEPHPGVHEDLANELRERNAAEMIQGTWAVADEVTSYGQQSWLYEFDWEVPTSGWGSPHCMELPYLFGTQDAWLLAPVLNGADWQLLECRGKRMRAIWGSFARDGDPGAGWQSTSGNTRVINRFE